VVSADRQCLRSRQAADGVYGIRLTHNVEAIVTGFLMAKN
jgi:hypothetical protein